MIFNTKDYITEAMRQLINEEYCKKVEKDLTPDYEQLINQSTDELISYQRWRLILERGTGQLLKPTNSRLRCACFPRSISPTIWDDRFSLLLIAIRRNNQFEWTYFLDR